MATYEWNDPSRLPPVECPLVICVGKPTGAHIALKVERTSHLRSRDGEMEYRSLATGNTYTGRYPWSYP